jgi:hypothetical protein
MLARRRRGGLIFNLSIAFPIPTSQTPDCLITTLVYTHILIYFLSPSRSQPVAGKKNPLVAQILDCLPSNVVVGGCLIGLLSGIQFFLFSNYETQVTSHDSQTPPSQIHQFSNPSLKNPCFLDHYISIYAYTNILSDATLT